MINNLSFLKYYLVGRGLDTSREQVVSLSETRDVTHWYKNPNNLYHVFANDDPIKYRSYDFVFNRDMVSQTKFYKILLKEWFCLLKVSGNLILQFQPSQFINQENIHEIMLLFHNNAELNYVHQEKDGRLIVVIRKIAEDLQLSENNDINQWSFGIIGKNIEERWVNDLIRSIKQQNIPRYEIILDANVHIDSLPKNVLYLSRLNGDTADVSIFAKKKSVCYRATYQNVMIFDGSRARVVLNKDWYEDIKAYQNEFELLSCVIKGKENLRLNDWQTLGTPFDYPNEKHFKYLHLGLLDYKDWDPWLYFSDPFIIMKKGIIKEITWDELDDDIERVIFCHDLMRKGFFMRFNPLASCKLWEQKETLGKLPIYEFDDQKLGKRQVGMVRQFLWLAEHLSDKIGVSPAFRSRVTKFLKDIRLYRFLIRH